MNNTVTAKSGAANVYQATLQDFKSAFKLKGSGFKNSVNSTKGVLYVKEGQLCSANRHGGKGSVESSVTNLALRNALIAAFRDAGATNDFLRDLRAKLLPEGQQENWDMDLDRKTVKECISKFETDATSRQSVSDRLQAQQTVGRKAFGVMIGTEENLSLKDFRQLALGSGSVGNDMVKSVDREIGTSNWTEIVGNGQHENEDYNASLRRELYAAIRDAKNPQELTKDQACARELLLQHLKATLVGSDLTKPLSCDEIRRTLAALDGNMSFVPSKALMNRKIRATHANRSIADICNRYENSAEQIDSFLASYGDEEASPCALRSQYADALRGLSAVRREMADVGRQFLRRDKADRQGAEDLMNQTWQSFLRNNPEMRRSLEELEKFCREGILTTKQRRKTIFLLRPNGGEDLPVRCDPDDQESSAFLEACRGDLLKAINVKGLRMSDVPALDVDNELAPPDAPVKAPAPKNAGGKLEALQVRARNFMDNNREMVERILNGFVRKDGGGQKKAPSEESRTVLRHFLQRSVESFYAQNGADAVVTEENLIVPGSAFHAMKQMMDRGVFSMDMAILSLTLQPQEADAFMKACQLVPDTQFGTVYHFHSVASQLAKVKPEQFTPENVIRLARPDLAPFPPEIRGKADLVDSKSREVLFDPFWKQATTCLQLGAQKDPNDAGYAVHNKIELFVSSGMSLREVQAVLDNPESFSLKELLLPEFFLPKVVGVEQNVRGAVRTLVSDISRNKLNLSVVRENGIQNLVPDERPNEMDEADRYKIDEDRYKKWISEFCGSENVLQQQLVTLFMSQNTALPEQMVNCCFGNSIDNLTNTQFLLKADPETGDVYVSKTTDPALDFGYSVTVRIGRDGSMSVIDLQERRGVDNEIRA